MPGFAPFAGPGDSAPSRGKLPNIFVPPLRRSIASFLLLLAVTSALSGQSPGPGPRDVVLRVYTFKYQQASEALPLVYPLLSPRGTVEVQPAGNTLVIRDQQGAINRIMPLLRSLDHPVKALRLDVVVVRASRSPAVSPQYQHSDLPPALTKYLRDLLAYDIFEVQARAHLSGAEGQWVIYELGPEYKVSFRFGTLQPDQQVKLRNFKIARRIEGRAEKEMLQSTVTLGFDRPFSLGLAKSEASREAMMVVLTLREGH
jgi:hypothetical protein